MEPQRGEFDAKALRFYDKLVDAMLAKGIEPLLTLDHWDYPRWVYDQGSWTNAETVKDFARFVKVVAKRYRRRVGRWLTFNEAFFYRLVEVGYRPLTGAQADTMITNLIAAHRRAYDLIHRYNDDAQVSSNVAWRGPDTLSSDRFVAGVADKLDYAALDYYYPGYQATDLSYVIAGTAWLAQLDPFGMYTALRTFHRAFPGLPVLVAENGMPTDNGSPAARRLPARAEPRGQRLLAAAGAPRRRAGDRLPVLEPDRQLRVRELRLAVRALPGRRHDRSDAAADPDGRRRGVPVGDLQGAASGPGTRSFARLPRRDCAKVVEADRAACLAAAG